MTAGRGSITDVAGIEVGHHHRCDPDATVGDKSSPGSGWACGTTVVLAPPGTVGAVDVRGGAPGSRETELLQVSNSVRHVDAVVLTGGSAFGLAAADGVMTWLEERDRGVKMTGGTVRIAGADMFSLDEDARAAVRARSVGFVFQSLQLLGNLTAIENVMLPLELAGRPDARAAAARMLERVGLGTRLKSYPKVLSGGEQQRVALARAFVVQPVLLLADEPTGSLDYATGETIMALMLALNQEQGTTLVLVTHDRGIAARCSRVFTMEAGRLREGAQTDLEGTATAAAG